MTLIRRDSDEPARIVENTWVTIADGDPIPEHGDAIVSLERLRGEREVLCARTGKIGLQVSGDADPDELAAQLDGVALIAIEFPKFSDGRGYSLARILRSRHGFVGELRATGDVLRDQIFYLWRCGFTSFLLAPGRDPEDALRAFADFSVSYQPAEDHDLPIWRRRAHDVDSPES